MLGATITVVWVVSVRWCMVGISKRGRVRLRTVWQNMLMRCYDERTASSRFYKDNRITVCKEWVEDYTSFEEWAFANGYDEHAKSFECTLDRINPFGNYCPENCRWVNAKKQAQNRRPDYVINASDDFIGTEKAAEYLGLSRSQVAQKTKDGSIPAMRIGGSYIYSKTVLSIMGDTIFGRLDMANAPWTEEEDFKILNPGTTDINELSEAVGRSATQIYSRLYRLGTSWGAVRNKVS